MSSQTTFSVCLLLLLACAGLLNQSVQGQAVNSRAANPDEPRISSDSDSSSGLGGPARNMYSQKLSGHRMMHFGKRPLVAGPPALLLEQPNNQALDLYANEQQSFPMMASRANFARNQQLDLPLLYNSPILDEELKAASRKQHLMEIVSNLLELSRRQDLDEQEAKQKRQNKSIGGQQHQALAKPPPAFKLMRLVQEGGDNAFGIESGNLYNIQGKRRANLAADDEIIDLDRHLADQQRLMRSQNLLMSKPAGEEQVDERQVQEGAESGGGDINLASRSVPIHAASSGDAHGLTRAQISNILYGRQLSGGQQRGNTILGMGNFIKKTEPQRMAFMHFG